MPQRRHPYSREHDQCGKLGSRTGVLGALGQFVFCGGGVIDGGLDGGVEQLDDQRDEGCDDQQHPDGQLEVEAECQDDQPQVEPAQLAERTFMAVGSGKAVHGIATGIDDAPDAGLAFLAGCVGFVVHEMGSVCRLLRRRARATVAIRAATNQRLRLSQPVAGC